MNDLLSSARAIAFLCILATDKPVDYAVAEVRDSPGPFHIRDPRLKADPVRLLRILYETFGDWNWAPRSTELARELPQLRPQLERLAAELEMAPATASWWQTLDRQHQVWAAARGSVPTETLLGLDERTHPWASKPRGGLWTSTALPELPSTWLLGGESQSVGRRGLWRLPVPAAASVWELSGPSAWIELCRRYPQDSTSTYGKQWRQWGLTADRVVTPDWLKVARDWDGMHLSVGGLLKTEGLPLAIEGAGTMLEGWGVESTLWLRWPFGQPQRLPD